MTGAAPGNKIVEKPRGYWTLVAFCQTTRNARPPWVDDWASSQSFSTAVKLPKLHHARRSPLERASTVLVPQTGCQDPEQLVRTFYLGALGRPPNPTTELQPWMNSFFQAQAQGTRLATAQNLGSTLFTSAEYTYRNRDNGQFVTDLYAAYLGRAADGPITVGSNRTSRSSASNAATARRGKKSPNCWAMRKLAPSAFKACISSTGDT